MLVAAAYVGGGELAVDEVDVLRDDDEADVVVDDERVVVVTVIGRVGAPNKKLVDGATVGITCLVDGLCITACFRASVRARSKSVFGGASWPPKCINTYKL